jgi:hypothetical protein
MATPAQIAANRRNAEHSTGARSPEGKARVASNAISFGLFSVTDFVRPAEAPEYATFIAAWRKQLAATGPAEETIAVEITRAAWRLRRCALTESELADPAADRQLDPLIDPATAPLQTAIDRAHTNAHSRLLRSMAELRRLQTERHFREALLGDDQEASDRETADPTLGLTNCMNLTKVYAIEARRKLWVLPPAPTQNWVCSADQPEAPPKLDGNATHAA